MARRCRAAAAARRYSLDRRIQPLGNREDTVHRPRRGNAMEHQLRRKAPSHHLQLPDPRRIRSSKQKLEGPRAPRGRTSDAEVPWNAAARGEARRPRTPHRQPRLHLRDADRRSPSKPYYIQAGNRGSPTLPSPKRPPDKSFIDKRSYRSIISGSYSLHFFPC